MPAVSEAQEKAMRAAAAGKSTLGIPKAVAEEYLAADDTGPRAAGIVFVAPDGDVLLLRRSAKEKNYAGHWGLPGGGAEDGETASQAALREAREEIGFEPAVKDIVLKLLDRVKTPTGMMFSTFGLGLDAKFETKLNDEHDEARWFPLNALPKPLHPSVEHTLGPHLGVTGDMSPDDWTGLREGFLKWTREEEDETEHAQDDDYYAAVDSDLLCALDRNSARTYDRDGRLHVEMSNISKATVNEYLGREIPDFDMLGLEPNKRYRLLRDPEELAKAVPTFNNLPLLSQHQPVTADSHPKELVIGALGSDAAFEAPFLRNSLVIWSKPDIDDVESEKKKELSCGYRYRADMTPGTYQSQQYDGVMRDIVGNHIALVKEGRAGPDVVVGDQALPLQLQEVFDMSKIVLTRKAAVAQGAILALLKPKLAQDAKLVDLSPVFKGITAKNYAEKTKEIAIGIRDAMKGKLAQDADMSDVAQMLDALSEMEVAEGADIDPSSGLPMSAEAMDDDLGAKIGALLKGKVDDDTIAQVMKMCAGGDAEIPAKVPGADAEEDEDDKKKKDMVTPAAMDAAIKLAVDAAEKRAEKKATETQKEIRDAERTVRPWVGDLAMAHDSAEGVYRTALTSLGVKVEGVHPSALPAILQAQPLPGKKAASTTTVAMDAATDADFAKRYPGAAKIRISH